MARAGLSPRAVVDAALAIVDEQGEQAVTLAAVAARTGVATPSLYKHVASLTDLRRLMALRVLEDVGELTATAVLGRSRDDAVAAAMTALRDYVRRSPRRYPLMPMQPIVDPLWAEAGRRLLDVLIAVVRGYGLTDSAAVHGVRRLRAALHGFASIEAVGGFGLPEDVDETFASLVEMVCASLRPPPPV